MKLSIVVCVRNQHDTLLATLDRLWASAPDGWGVEVVVVDNHSTDGTRDLLHGLDAPNLLVIYQRRWASRAACWHTAILHLRGDYVLFDRGLPGERVPPDLAALANEAERGAAAIYSAPQNERGRRDLVTWLLNALFGGDLSDVLGASKLVRADVLKALNLWGDGVAFEIGLTARLLRAGVEVRQVAVAGHGHPPRTARMEVFAALAALLSARLDPSPVWRGGQRPALSGTPGA